MYLDSHKDVEKRRRDRINSYLETIRELLPIYKHLPKQKRIDKADLLDMTIVYLKTVNSFLQNLGVKDVFCAIHQHLTLLNSSEKWIQSNADSFDSVPSFVYGLSKHLQSEHRETTKLLAETVAISGASRSDHHTSEFFPWSYFLHSPSDEKAARACCSKDDDKMWKTFQRSLIKGQKSQNADIQVDVGPRVELPPESIQSSPKRHDKCKTSTFAVESAIDPENNNSVFNKPTEEKLQQVDKPVKMPKVLYCLPKETQGGKKGGHYDPCDKVSQPSTSQKDYLQAKKCHCDLKILMRDQAVNTEEKADEGLLKKEVTLTVNTGKVELDIASLLSQAKEGNCVVPVTFQGQVCLGIKDPGKGEGTSECNSLGEEKAGST